MTNIDSVTGVLDALRKRATSARDLGDRFERLIQSAFRIDRTYRERFTDVWLWMEWPGRRNEPDTGIDLVARTTDGRTQGPCEVPESFGSVSMA